jgi:hypothetical protein
MAFMGSRDPSYQLPRPCRYVCLQRALCRSRDANSTFPDCLEHRLHRIAPFGFACPDRSPIKTRLAAQRIARVERPPRAILPATGPLPGHLSFRVFCLTSIWTSVVRMAAQKPHKRRAQSIDSPKRRRAGGGDLEKMLSLIRTHPGIRPSELDRRLNREQSDGLRNTLIKRGLIRKEKDGSAMRYYPL